MCAKRFAPESSALQEEGRIAEGLERPELYINRELSQLEFSRRVLEEAEDSRHPLLERVKFLAIFESTIDDFFVLRVSGLKEQQTSKVIDHPPDGLTPTAQLAAIRQRLIPMLAEQRQVLKEVLLPALAEAGVQILNYEQLDEAQRIAAAAYFHREVFPIVTPLAVDPGHPFPHISNLSLNLAVILRSPLGRERFARLKIPPTLPRFVPVPVAPKPSEATSPESDGFPASSLLPVAAEGATPPIPSSPPEPERVAFVWLEQVVAAHLESLFRGMEIVQAYPFRVLRDADIEIQEDEASDSDLLEEVQHGLRERRFGAPVQLCVDTSMPHQVCSLLLEHLELEEEDVLVFDGPLGLDNLMELLRLERPDLKDKPLAPRVAPELAAGRDPFIAIAQGDLLLHHPYDSFSSVAEFIQAAAHDPQVVAIKQTLYRVGKDSPVVKALLEAIEHGKQVAVLVELKARFDEENNIEWARTLEEAGVHVTYGLVGLKTHAKVALVVRRERDGLHRYVHLGTGNYNASTARTYEDFCLITADPDLGADASELFNALTGYSLQREYRKLLVAPLSLRREALARIDHVIQRHREGAAGRIIIKVNALVDPEMIRALYRASRAGVQVDLIVRGICCLRPGVPDVSERIRVISLVGRFLEHSRIFYFANGNGHRREEELYLGSADLMPRNLDRRVEVLFPIEQPQLRAALRDKVLLQLLKDTVNARELQPDGSYRRRRPAEGHTPLDMQQWFATNPLFRVD
ncbi:MAG TPA: polyphosphate kinase 1 [Ktedonobacterales bacterium]|nr:polyphosphate kinase 1 [Ktedonobacterales bacterium]